MADQPMKNPAMQLICSRTIPSLDARSLVPTEAREALFRADSGFLLYLSDGATTDGCEERVVKLGLREALVWLNEEPQDAGSFWT
jgi:hypothetical protein